MRVVYSISVSMSDVEMMIEADRVTRANEPVVHFSNADFLPALQYYALKNKADLTKISVDFSDGTGDHYFDEDGYLDYWPKDTGLIDLAELYSKINDLLIEKYATSKGDQDAAIDS